MKLLWVDIMIVVATLSLFTFLTKRTHDGWSIFLLWFYGTIFVLPIPITLVNSILYPKWYGYDQYYIAFLPLISTVLCILVPKMKDMRSVYRFKKHKKPVRIFAKEVIQKHGLGQENTGNVMRDTIQKGYGTLYGKLYIELIKEEKELLEEKKEIILQEFAKMYPSVDFHVYTNDFITLEKVRRERELAKKFHT